jgi:hypothetical protein
VRLHDVAPMRRPARSVPAPEIPFAPADRARRSPGERSRGKTIAACLAAVAAVSAGVGALVTGCGGGGSAATSSGSGTTTGPGGSGGSAGGAGAGGTGGMACEPGPPIDADKTDLDTQLPLPPKAVCAPSGGACAAPSGALFASYRKDFFYPYSLYPEAKIPDPVGGRAQVVATAAVTGKVTGLSLRGEDAEALLQKEKLDWYHVYPHDAVAGQPVWIAFHSRDVTFADSDVDVAVHTQNGDAVSGVFHAAKPGVRISYVVPDEARDELTIFVQNRDAAAHTMKELFVNGAPVTTAACIPQSKLAPGATALWTVPLCSPLARGGAWTVAITFEDAPPAVAAGRAITTHFPIEYWPRSHECAFPSSDSMTEAAWKEIRSRGFDTMFLQVDWSKCPAPISPDDFLAQLGPEDFHAMLGSGEPKTHNDDPRVLAVMIADEPDKDYGDPADPTSGPKGLAKQAEAFWDGEPAVATFVGGSRHRYSGAYDGVADIAGMDIYAAGCAPHITDVGAYPPLRAPYDYAVAVRENHMPLPAWIYAQAFNTSSNSATLDRQASPAEARVQAYGVIAAGAKGLMYFQLILEEAHKNPQNEATWAELGDVNKEIGAVRRFLSEGDPTGAVRVLQGNDLIVEAIRSQRAFVVPVISTSTCSGPTDADCFLNHDVHWAFRETFASIAIDVPDDFPVVEAFEVSHAGVAPLKGTLNGRSVEVHGIALGPDRPTRLFVLAADASVKTEVAKGL